MASGINDVSATPWWLEAGSAQCDFCNRAHFEEAAYECAVCDRPVCAACVMTLYRTRQTLCPQCHAEMHDSPR